MTSTLHLRAATPDDLGFVLGLAARFAEVRPDWRSEAEITEGTKRQLRDALLAGARDDAYFAIALDATGDRLGFIWVVTELDFFTGEAYAHISEVAAVRDGAGTGRVLVQAAQTWARERGYRFVSLNVRPGNDRAKKLYDALGFEIDVEHRIKPLR